LVNTYIKAKKEELKGTDLLGVMVNDNYIGCRVFEVQYLAHNKPDISIIKARLNLPGRNIDIINNLDGMILKPNKTLNILTKTDTTSSSSSNIQSANHALVPSQEYSKYPQFVYCDNLVRAQYPYELTKAQIVAGQVKSDKSGGIIFMILYSSFMGRYEAIVYIKDNQGTIKHFNALPGNPPLDKFCKTWSNGVCK
jgi:hypothetical protein